MTQERQYPLLRDNIPVGTVTVRQAGLMTEISCKARLRESDGVTALFARFGDTVLRLGILQPENGQFVMTKRFSRNALMGHRMEELSGFFPAAPSQAAPEPAPSGLTVPLDPEKPFPLLHLLPYGILTEDGGALFFPLPQPE